MRRRQENNIVVSAAGGSAVLLDGCVDPDMLAPRDAMLLHTRAISVLMLECQKENGTDTERALNRSLITINRSPTTKNK